MPLGDVRPTWNVVFEYSEWLDQQGLMIVREDDVRTHENLVDVFFHEREAVAFGEDDEDAHGGQHYAGQAPADDTNPPHDGN